MEMDALVALVVEKGVVAALLVFVIVRLDRTMNKLVDLIQTHVRHHHADEVRRHPEAEA